MNKKKVLAISGSTRQNSINYSLLKAIAEISAQSLDITIFNGIGNLPQFNSDNDEANVAEEIAEFRQQLKNADGVIICTPEYAHGVPGTLKNAIDWTISSSSFPQKPTMLITASTGGHYGHKALLETLRAIEAKNVDNLQMVIPFAKTKISMDSKITDEKTLVDVTKLIADFTVTLNNNLAYKKVEMLVSSKHQFSEYSAKKTELFMLKQKSKVMKRQIINPMLASDCLFFVM